MQPTEGINTQHPLAGGQPEQAGLPAPVQAPTADQYDPADGLPSEVLERQYKLKLVGSRRMLTRDKQRELLQWYSGFLMNGSVMEGLLSQGLTVDMRQIQLAARDALGIEWPYEFVRPMNPQEQQARSTPPPQVQAQMQQSQQELQTRVQLMQSKNESAEKIAAMQIQVKNSEISEESAWRILDILQREKESILTREDPEAKRQMMEQEMASKQQQGDQKIQMEREKHQMDMAAQMQQHSMDMRQGQQENALSLRTQQLNSIAGLAQGQAKHEQTIQQMKEKSAASRVLGGPENKSRPSGNRK